MGQPILRVRLTSQGWSGGPGLNTFYFAHNASTDPVVQADADTVVARVRSVFAGRMALWPTNWTANVSESVDVIDAADGDIVAQFTAPTTTLLTGTSSNPMGPATIGLCLTQNTAQFIAGRRLRGRTFLVPIIQNGDTNGTPDSGSRSVASGLAADMITDPALGPAWCVWHRPKDPAPGSLAHVTSVTISDKWAVLRSRRD